uniref:HPP transmembrane region domain-containing protein n=1 Tax=Hemiselmis tepida TaxID=464990 RepID=A0A7S0VHV0_9CRYP|mmetsp:Transcript_19345/g.48973  ORF Transcript_19345/g.48973 Transcript_19345/m.48973 type:complete len:595 (+) Transcript_19345:240-2024(+)
MEVDLLNPPKGHLADIVRDLCISSGLPFGEVWIRPRTAVVPESFAKGRNGSAAFDGLAAIQRLSSTTGHRRPSGTQSASEGPNRETSGGGSNADAAGAMRGKMGNTRPSPIEILSTAGVMVGSHSQPGSFDVGLPPTNSSPPPVRMDGAKTRQFSSSLSAGALWGRMDGEGGGSKFAYGNFLQHSGAFYTSPAVLGDPHLKAKVQSFMNLNARTYLEGQGIEGLAWERGEADYRDLAEAKAGDALTCTRADACTHVKMLDHVFVCSQSPFPNLSRPPSNPSGEDSELCSDPRCALTLDTFGGSLSIPIRVNEGHGRQREHVVAVLVLYSLSFEDLSSPTPGYVATNSRDFCRYVQDSLPLCVQLHYTQADWEQTKSSMLPLAQISRVSSFTLSTSDVEESQRLSSFLANFFNKMRGQKASAPRPNSAEFCLVTFVGCFTSLLALSAIDNALRPHIFSDEQMPLLVGSFGALATLVFAAPVVPLAQPRIVVGGHIISAIVGISMGYLTSDRDSAILPQWVANALAPAVAITLMAATGMTHPPAGACTLIYISNASIKSLGWLFILVPVITGSLVMLGIALFVNNLSKHRKYPLFW